MYLDKTTLFFKNKAEAFRNKGFISPQSHESPILADV